MARLPHVGGDKGSWGQVLNDYLSTAHTSSGSLKSDAIEDAGAITKINTKTGPDITLTATDVSAEPLGLSPETRETVTPRSGSRPIGQGELVINAADYGAVGDGATDDFDALQNALNATPAGGIFFIPPGTYYLAKTSGGGLRIPCYPEGITIMGAGKGATTLKLSAEVLRAFDFLATSIGMVYQKVRIAGFTVDGNNIGPFDVGPSTPITASVTLTNGASTNISVPSTQGWASKGLLYFAPDNAGTAAKQFHYVKRNGTSLTISNSSGTDAVVQAGDIIQGAISDHVVVGTLISGYSTSPTNMCFDDIEISDIETVNVPSYVGKALGSNATGNWRPTINIIPLGSAAHPLPAGSPMYVTRVALRRIVANGGEGGFVVAGNGQGPNIHSPYFDNIVFEDLFHDIGVAPTKNYTSQNFIIGANGWGGRAYVSRCVGRNSGDVGIEVDSLLDVTVTDCEISNAAGGSYYTTNFNYPAATKAGAPTTTIAANVGIGDTTMTLSSLPSGVPRSGQFMLGAELISYTAGGGDGRSLTVKRALNTTVAASYAAGATVQFFETWKQSIKFIRCRSVHSKEFSVSAANTWMPKGWYQLAPKVCVNPPLVIEDCEYLNEIQTISANAGEAIHLVGDMSRLRINGFLAERHFSSTTAVAGQLIRIASTSGTATQAIVQLKNITTRVTGSLVSGATYNSLILNIGSWILDWDNLQMLQVIATPDNLATGFINIGSGNSLLSGRIKGVRFTSQAGDYSPSGIACTNASGVTIRGLKLADLDFTDFQFSTSIPGDGNYRPLNIAYAYLPYINIENVIHSRYASSALYAASPTSSRKILTSSATLQTTDEYIACQHTAPITITLLASTTSATYKTIGIGRTIIIKDESTAGAATNNITVIAASGETIDGAASTTIATNYGVVRLRSIGTGWVTV